MDTMNSTQETILKNWVNNHLDLTLDILAREMLTRVENREFFADGVEEIDQLFQELGINPIPDEDFEIFSYYEGYQIIFEDSDEKNEDDE